MAAKLTQRAQVQLSQYLNAKAVRKPITDERALRAMEEANEPQVSKAKVQPITDTVPLPADLTPELATLRLQETRRAWFRADDRSLMLRLEAEMTALGDYILGH